MRKSESIAVKKPVGIWIRVSTEDQAKGDSPEHHERRARFYAESKGWEVGEVYHLDGFSGKTVWDNPQTQQMLKDIKQGKITGLIFSKLARLARNTRELLDFADRFREADADLISLQESIDTSTPAGRLFYTMIAAMAQWEREEIADRVSASINIRAKLGKPLNGKSPFGYHWVDKRLVPHTQEAPVRKLIYDLYLEYRRKKRVAKVLNERGYRTREGNRWSDTSIDRLLRDPTAKGMRRANFTTNGDSKMLKPESEWIWTEVEPIVTEETWEQCNKMLDERMESLRRKGRRPVHLFAGLTHCYCGNKMYVITKSPKYVCQKCRNKIPVVDLEAIFCEQLKAFFLSPAEVAEHLKKADEHLGEKEKLLQSLQEKHSQLQGEIQRVYQLYVDKKIDGDGFSQFYKPLEERKRQMDEELPRLQAEVDLLKINHISSDQVLTEAKDLHSRWPSLTVEEKQRIVESVTEKIIIGTDEVNITLCHLPSSEEVTKWQRSLPDGFAPASLGLRVSHFQKLAQTHPNCQIHSRRAKVQLPQNPRRHLMPNLSLHLPCLSTARLFCAPVRSQSPDSVQLTPLFPTSSRAHPRYSPENKPQVCWFENRPH